MFTKTRRNVQHITSVNGVILLKKKTLQENKTVPRQYLALDTSIKIKIIK